MSLVRYLSCPIIRPAVPEDADSIARLELNSGSEKISGVFRDNIEGALEVLTKQFSEHYEGVYVLTEGEIVIGAMKLHLPGKKIGKTISLRSLISILGIRKGIRAMLLLSPWDEYRLHHGESYLEFMYVDTDWQGFGGGKLLVNHAKKLAADSHAKYLSLFVASKNYKARGLYEDAEFVPRRRIYSPVAKILRTTYKWRKYTFTLINGPITVKEKIQERIDTAKVIWQRKRRQVLAATRLTFALTIVPLVAGLYAYFRGYPLAALGWAIIASFHLLGSQMYKNGSTIGRVGIAAALIPEGINILLRSISTNSWFDRGWLLPLSLIDMWIVVVVITANPELQPHTSSLERPMEVTT
ncbi:MAG: GNAT family N-acetyltransferase [Candidatus Kariarchaeaceae archaeon]|jgi:ribosomal protein S18 acetylase RimI-like enzyme